MGTMFMILGLVFLATLGVQIYYSTQEMNKNGDPISPWQIFVKALIISLLSSVFFQTLMSSGGGDY